MIADIVIKCRWGFIAFWIALTAALLFWTAPVEPGTSEVRSYLPESSPYSQALAVTERYFPRMAAQSEAVIVLERRKGALTPADLAAVEAMASSIRTRLPQYAVRSPGAIALPQGSNPLISPAGSDGQAALLMVNVQANFITIAATRAVEAIRQDLLAAKLPAGLTAHITGSAAFGHDYGQASGASSHRTTLVTLAAVLIILLLVYRAPLAALVPLAAISAAAVISLKILDVLQTLGMPLGTPERIFVMVLLYGAGTDYALLYISRYRETLDAHAAPLRAAAEALRGTFSAIFASGITDALSILTLSFVSFVIFRSTGPAVAIALVVAMTAALTLVPAIVAVLGRRLFWPVSQTPAVSRKVWPFVARVVIARPLPILLVTVALMAIPAARALDITWVYDTLADLRGDYESPKGLLAAQRHWPRGETGPVTAVIEAPAPLTRAKWTAHSKTLSDAMLKLTDGGARIAGNIRSLSSPVGVNSGGTLTTLLLRLADKAIAGEYLSDDGRAMRMVLVLDEAPLTLAAMGHVDMIQKTLDAQAASALGGRVYLTGPTAQMLAVKTVTRSDFHMIVPMVLGVIFTVVLCLLRDVLLTLFMVATTVLTYLATLGISYWVFVALLGAEGLDWKVQVFLFIVVTAVGVDYNIFLAARLFQEARRHSPLDAVREAIIHTGPVISSCGLIMAATLGSLLSGDLALLIQLGFAFALGMLLDTFVVRPLVLPSFVVLTGRLHRRQREDRREDETLPSAAETIA
ncbi:MAG: MMPL family transporter [Planctomycetaceae bacterium]|nr:MMPL family transporter [Planctomycetaceae bacterium]